MSSIPSIRAVHPSQAGIARTAPVSIRTVAKGVDNIGTLPLGVLMAACLLVSATDLHAGPFAPAAGQAGSTAIAKGSPLFTAWATGWQDYRPGTDVDAGWQTPPKALGPAVGDAYDIVSLGNGGSITLTFAQPIADGDGSDFAVFENSLSDTFLELAWVEVSSNGTDFYRFPNYSYTPSKVGAFGAVDPTNIDGLAGKYRQGYGTPFDLSDLSGIPDLDLNNIGYVRIKDILGNGTEQDSSGNPIYDPYKTTGSAGFDLDAIGVIHQKTQAANRAPVADAGADQTVNGGSVVRLQGSATDSDGVIAAYQWSQTAGSGVDLADAATATPSFAAPTGGDGVLEFQLVALDNDGASSDADSVRITVRNKPLAVAGDDRSASPQETLALDGSASQDPQGQALGYQWTQVAGPQAALSDAHAARPSLTVPVAAVNTQMSFQLVVTDPDGNASDPAVVNIMIKVVNHPPVAELPESLGIRAGATLVLDGTASYDPDFDALGYAWEQTSGPAVTLSSPTAAKPTTVVPLAALGQTLGFRLTVSDGSLRDSRETQVAVTANNPPTITPEPRRLAAPNQAVILHATALDPDGDALHYQWEQTGGPAVPLQGADGPELRLTTPALADGTAQSLTLRLTATDDFGPDPRSASAEFNLLVTADGTALDCGSARPSRASLWPPNQGFKPVHILGVTGPNAYTLAIDAVSQDEPVRNPKLKDKTGPDAKIVKPRATAKEPKTQQSVLLRAERQGRARKGQPFTGNGRVYTVRFSANDGVQSCQGTITVQVPPNKQGTAVLDTAASYKSTQKR
ncbi:PKD domain-containing protein [Methylomagnum ishizawai]|nr:PKD domain-containing protein [Methylomagnum ishizawai]